jgi:TatD DNase family protein
MKLFDSHCHLDFDAFAPDRKDVIARAVNAGVRAIFVPGVSRQQSVNNARSDDNQWPGDCAGVTLLQGFGLHPYFIQQHHDDDLQWLAQQLESNPTAAVGEIGLDACCEDYAIQTRLFTAQVDLACEFQRPVVIHHRKTQPELLRKLKQARNKLPENPGVIHAFSGSKEQANAWIELGFMLGVGGTITYDRASKTRAAVAQAKLSHLLLETDAPDMPISGYQGQRNEPAHCSDVVRVLAELREESAEELAVATWNNACRLFGWHG